MVIEAALYPEGRERKRGRPDKTETKRMAIVAQKNPRKTLALAKIRSGRMTIPQAAKYAGVPVSGMVTWCRLKKVPLPPEYDAHRHRDAKAFDEVIELARGVVSLSAPAQP